MKTTWYKIEFLKCLCCHFSLYAAVFIGMGNQRVTVSPFQHGITPNKDLYSSRRVCRVFKTN